MTTKSFQNKTANVNKLIKYGFSCRDGNYHFEKPMLDGQFMLIVDISGSDIATMVIDRATDEEYSDDAVGAFVGSVREEYAAALDDIAQNCFDSDVFTGETASAVVNYGRDKYDDEPQFLWDDFPMNAILRRKDSGKWYGLMVRLQRKKLGLDKDGAIDILVMRGDPEDVAAAIESKRFFAAYHMNKARWFTVCLDGSVPSEEICALIDKSYELAK